MNSAQLPIRKFPCPGCGADLDFDPGIGRLKCPHCNREEAIPQTAEEIQAHDYEEYFSGKRTRLSRLAAAAVELDCPDCGAGIIFEPPDSAGQCPFCAANLSIAQTRLASATLSPEGIVPFQCDRATAQKQLQRWLKQRWLAPFGFSRLVQPDKLEGVYLPHWTYDFQTTTRYTGSRYVYYGGNENRQSTSGTVDCSFKGVLVPATTSVSSDCLQALRPWQGKDTKHTFFTNLLSFLKELRLLFPVQFFNQPDGAVHPLQADLRLYSSAYLAGFKAQRPQVSLKAGFETSQKQVKTAINCAICDRLGGEQPFILGQSTAYSAITFKLVLLPLWLCAYRYQDKQYQVAINGCTQKLQGNYPISRSKRFLMIVFAITIVTTALIKLLSLPIPIIFLILFPPLILFVNWRCKKR